MMYLTGSSFSKYVGNSYTSIAKNPPKTNHPIKKWAKALDKDFFRENMSMAHGYMEKMLNITNHQENAN